MTIDIDAALGSVGRRIHDLRTARNEIRRQLHSSNMADVSPQEERKWARQQQEIESSLHVLLELQTVFEDIKENSK